MLKVNIILSLVCTSIFVFFLVPHRTLASGEAYGWFAPTVEYIGEGTTCPFNKLTFDIALAQENSTSTYSYTVGSWSLIISDLSDVVVFSDTYNGQLISNQYCVDPGSYKVQVTLDDSADTYEIKTPLISPQRSFGIGATIAKTPGSPSSQYRGYVHLQSKNSLIGGSTISSLSPDNSAVKTSPDFFVRTNKLPAVYGPSTLKSIAIRAYDIANSTYVTGSALASGGVATRQVSVPTLTTDGAYLWSAYQTYTGTNHAISPFIDQTYNSIPVTGWTSPLSFIIDSQIPEVNTIKEVSTIGPVGSNQVEVKVKVDAQDTLSGSVLSILKVNDMTSGIPVEVARVTTSLSRQLDLLNLEFNVILAENKTYTFNHELQDWSGNVSVSNTFSYSVPTVTSLSAPILETRNASDIQTNQAYLPSYISSNGGSGIVDRGTCWSLFASESFGYTTSLPPGMNCLNETSWESISDIGLIGFTHVNLPASTTIFYRGYAQNGTAIGYSPWGSFKTLPDGTEISPTPTMPVIGAVYSDPTYANSINATLRLDSTGGSLITTRALCWATVATLLPLSPTGPNCVSDDSLMNVSFTLPNLFSHIFYYVPADTDIYIKAFVANSVGTTTLTTAIRTPKSILDIAQPDFTATPTYDSVTQTYTIDFSVSADDLSNFFPVPTIAGVSSGNTRVVPYTAELINSTGVTVDSLSGTVKAHNNTNLAVPAEVIPLQFTSVSPGIYQLKVEVNSPEAIYAERAASSTAGLNNLRIKLLNLPDSSGTPFPPPIFISPNVSLYFNQKIARTEMPTKLYWDTKLPLDLSCKIYGGNDFGPSAIYSFNPAIDGQIGSVELTKLKNFQTFELTCADLVAGTGLVISTTTSISTTGSYTPI